MVHGDSDLPLIQSHSWFRDHRSSCLRRWPITKQGRVHSYPSRMWVGRAVIEKITRSFGQGQWAQNAQKRHKSKLRTDWRTDEAGFRVVCRVPSCYFGCKLKKMKVGLMTIHCLVTTRITPSIFHWQYELHMTLMFSKAVTTRSDTWPPVADGQGWKCAFSHL